MNKPLTKETQEVVDQLRMHKAAVETLFTGGDGKCKPALAYALGAAISRLSLLDVRLERERQINAIELREDVQAAGKGDAVSEWLCATCGCAEEEHGGEGNVCTGCGEECEFEEPDDADAEDDD